MAISSSPVQQKISDAWPGSGSNITITGISTPTAGNVLVLYYGGTPTTTAVSTVTQTNVVWTAAVSNATGRYASIWYGIVSASAGTTITIGLSATPGTAGTQSAEVSEWSGIDTTTPVDVTGTNGATSTNPTTGTMSPTAGLNALIIGAIRAGNVPSATPASPFTDLTSSDGGVRNFGTYQVVTSTTSTYTATWTALSGTWGCAYAVFKAPAATTIPNKIFSYNQAVKRASFY